jgi:hypothetical protein
VIFTPSFRIAAPMDWRTPAGDRIAAAVLVVGTAVAFAAFSEVHRHWFLVPVVICGLIVSPGAVGWIRGRYDLFDIVRIIDVVSVHFFFLAPLLHLWLDYWLPFAAHPDDWRPWLARMGWVNVAGLLCYRLCLHLTIRARAWRLRSVWEIHGIRFFGVVAPLALIIVCVQIVAYTAAGGIGGSIDLLHTPDAFQGWGWVFMIADSLPILMVISYAVLAQRFHTLRSWMWLAVLFSTFIAAALLFGGLRGSRATVVWSLVWAAGIVHLSVRRLKRGHVAAGLAFVVVFMYFYGFYKAVRLDALQAITNSSVRAELEESTSRTWSMVLLGDMGRSDIQAYLLYRKAEIGDYDFQLGKTYLASLALLIPRQIWPDRPAGKTFAGTEIIRGRGTYSEDSYAQNIYGLAGEAFLNFGVVGAVLSYCVLAWVVGTLWRFAARLEAGDSRQLMIPLAAIVAFWSLVSDSDNVIWVIVKYGFVPFTLIYLTSVRIRTVPRAV